MKTFTLTVVAKLKDDGSYEYSLNVWENRNTGSLAGEMNFESEALRQGVNTALPGGAHLSNVVPNVEREGNFWFPFTMPMSDAQAANLGWLANNVQERTDVH